MRSTPFTGQIYHVYNRGVLKQPIFFDDRDHFRFMKSLIQFNDQAPGICRRPTSAETSVEKKPLVSILAWCLMPNHFHLLVEQIADNGLSLFMKKLGGGFTKYINTRYERSGHLFQGKYQCKLVDTDAYLLQLSRYIHLNPKELAGPLNPEKTMEFIENYRWSSYGDWINAKKNSKIIDSKRIKSLLDLKDYRASTIEALQTSNVGEDLDFLDQSR